MTRRATTPAVLHEKLVALSTSSLALGCSQIKYLFQPSVWRHLTLTDAARQKLAADVGRRIFVYSKGVRGHAGPPPPGGLPVCGRPDTFSAGLLTGLTLTGAPGVAATSVHAGNFVVAVRPGSAAEGQPERKHVYTTVLGFSTCRTRPTAETHIKHANLCTVLASTHPDYMYLYSGEFAIARRGCADQWGCRITPRVRLVGDHQGAAAPPPFGRRGPAAGRGQHEVRRPPRPSRAAQPGGRTADDTRCNAQSAEVIRSDGWEGRIEQHGLCQRRRQRHHQLY
jgi:hypothetical protein